MKSLFAFALVVMAAATSSGEVLCETTRYEPWPANPIVSITKNPAANGSYAVIVSRSYYGFPTLTEFMANAELDKGAVVFRNQDTLISWAQQDLSKAVIQSKEFGQQMLACKGSL